MAFQYVKLSDVVAVPQTPGALYTNPASTKSYLSSILVHNWGTVNRDVTLNVVPGSGGVPGSVSTGNQIAKVTLVPNETTFIEPKYPFVFVSQGDSLFGLASGGGVNLQVLGGTNA